MSLEVWCWPFNREHLFWTAKTRPFAGHAAISLCGKLYDLWPAKDRAVPGMTRQLERIAMNDPMDAMLDDHKAPGKIQQENNEDVAGDFAKKFDIAGQSFSKKVSVDNETGIFIANKGGMLPLVYTYNVPTSYTDDELQSLFEQHFNEVEQGSVEYHLIRHNCTHFVRETLSDCDIFTITGNGWTPEKRHPGAWRPDKFNELLQSRFDSFRRLGLALNPPALKRAGHKFVWKEIEQSIAGRLDNVEA